MDEKTKQTAIEQINNYQAQLSRRAKFPYGLPKDLEKTLLTYYGIAVNSRGATFVVDDNTISKVEKVAAWMTKSPRRGLFLFGSLGNGKTTMLRALKSCLGVAAVLCSAQEVYEYFRKNMFLPEVTQESGRVLLLDDLGSEAPTLNDFGTMRSPLGELLQYRYDRDATTVIATNLSGSQISEIYGDRVGDRFAEMFDCIRYTEPSYRSML